MENESVLKKSTEKLFGGLKMGWLTVILFAVGTAVLTSVFLIVPFFNNTSFYRMGEFLEAWILFAVIIMSNCKKPLESALKTFVFFLISQPLIYLIQVPFSSLGWQIFMFYRYWFFLTLLTFPMALIGWYIRRKNWLSLLILLPVLVYLSVVCVSSFQFAFKHFPYRLTTGLFCLVQIIVYLYVFTSGLWQRLIGFFVPIAAALIIVLSTSKVELSASEFLPDNPVLTEAAVAVSDNTELAEVSVEETGKDSMIHIKAHKYGTADFTIKDGKKEYRYSLEVYEDDGGHIQLKIESR